jgi:hypothetical protein
MPSNDLSVIGAARLLLNDSLFRFGKTHENRIDPHIFDKKQDTDARQRSVTCNHNPDALPDYASSNDSD